jgi:hypothetical protein
MSETTDEKGDLRKEHQISGMESRLSLAIGVGSESDSEEERGAKDIEAGHPEHTPVAKTVTAQDWTGPDDPENPHNWPLKKRAWHTLQPALFGLAV